jgi:hypothetical protein
MEGKQMTNNIFEDFCMFPPRIITPFPEKIPNVMTKSMK